MAKAQSGTATKAATQVTKSDDATKDVSQGKVSVNPHIPTDKELMAKAKADQAAKDQALKDTKAKEKADAAAAKKAAAETKKAEAEKAKAEKAVERAKAKADREARLEALKAEGKAYTGSMIALADRVKAGVYVKGASGQLRSNDELAIALDGVGPTSVVSLALDVLKLETNPYSHLNVGQQSMNLRNKMRGAIRHGNLKISDIADYIKRNHVHVTTAADIEAEAKAKAEKKAAADKAKADTKSKAEAKATT